MEFSNKIWAPIKYYENLYEVSNDGFVRSKNSGKIIKPRYPRGYAQVGLYKNGIRKGYYIHRLVAMAFIENSNNFMEVNHKDENSRNNNMNNLEWCDHKYNTNYGTAIKRRSEKLRKKVIQLNLEDKMIKTYDSISEASIQTKTNLGHICSCVKGTRKTVGGYKWILLKN